MSFNENIHLIIYYSIWNFIIAIIYSKLFQKLILISNH